MKKILMIDDDPEDQSTFAFALKQLNIKGEYVTADNGEEALEMISRLEFTTPDIIFVDLFMPGIGGFEFVIRMRRIPGYEDVPTYIYTSSTSIHEKINCLAAGATGYVNKQFTDAALANELKGLLQNLGMLV